jgi:hypothetical protein
MDPKHTPGPWEFIPSFGRVEVEKFIVAYLSLSVEGRENPLYLSRGEAEANGRLIAAAPELLDALEHMVAVANWSCTIQSEEQFDAMIATAEAAIRKAKGDQ